jgi:hypothetical protein
MAMTLVRALTYAMLICVFQSAQAQTIAWAGHTWKVTRGGMAGVAAGDPANVSIDADKYLHLHIVQHEGHQRAGNPREGNQHEGKWTAVEVFTTDRMGFGTYQWVIEGNVYAMDPVTVLGLFTYGPTHHIGVDAENEIDIEFSQWNHTCKGCNADFTVYPSTGNRKPKGVSAWEDNFRVSGENLTTARMERSPDHIVFTLMKGVQAVGTVADVIKTETYSSTATNIPQVASPVGINLWCFKKTPSRDQSVVIRDFQFVAQSLSSGTGTLQEDGLAADLTKNFLDPIVITNTVVVPY